MKELMETKNPLFIIHITLPPFLSCNEHSNSMVIYNNHTQLVHLASFHPSCSAYIYGIPSKRMVPFPDILADAYHTISYQR